MNKLSDFENVSFNALLHIRTLLFIVDSGAESHADQESYRNLDVKINRNEVIHLLSSVISSACSSKLQQLISFVTENLVSRSYIFMAMLICQRYTRPFNNFNYLLICIHFQKQPITHGLQNMPS